MKIIAFLGPRGTFTEEALNRLCQWQGLTVTKEATHTIEEAIEEAMTEKANYAFVPVENSLGGTVLTTMDYLAEHQNVEIVAEISMPIRHYVWGIPQASLIDLEAVYSHPQALRQCKRFLKDTLSAVKQEVTTSTAEGAYIVATAGNKKWGAIGGEAMGAQYKLIKLTDQVQDNAFNLTRFILVKPNEMIQFDASKVSGKVSLQCELDGLRPGSLWECLGIFAKRQINLVKIESRPTKGRLGDYKFFLDLQIDHNGAQIEEALAELKELATSMQLLGTYETYHVE
ncbi:prephenate dehydratase [Veillonella criceti]|uniref:Prephenate dehydratase n=1 Tax=Veillonella criceti TaxID=103891 RepID=A0A380NJG6_9FIRM|nr:prephenate dehydratase [Veillonella criceti]SUP41257.1 P-protein [Veillonella criceti]